MLSDSHAHLTLEHFDPDREAVIARAREAGIGRIVTIASFLGDAEACALLAARHDFIHFAAGVHPHEAKNFTPLSLGIVWYVSLYMISPLRISSLIW